MKSFFNAAIALGALTAAGMAFAANTGITVYELSETQREPDGYELQNARDAVEARAPISYEEKARLKREAAASRPGPDEQKKD